MSTINDFKAKIERIHFDEPDSYGEGCLHGCINLTGSGSHQYELFIIQQVLRSGNGSVLSISTCEHEDFLGSGDSLMIDFDLGYTPSLCKRSTPCVHLLTEIFGCSAAYGQFDPIQLNDANPGTYGLSNGFTLGGPDLAIESVSASVGPADEDGDVRLEVRALVYNQSNFFIPRLAFKARAIANGGREIDNQSTDEAIGPWERRLIELSFYSIKQNRLRDLCISAEMTAFKAVSHVVAEHQIEVRM